MANDIRLKIKATDETRGAFTSVQGSIAGMSRSMVGVMGSVAALAGVGGFGLLIKRTIDANDQMQKLNLRLGASTEALSQYKHVAELSGVSFETLTMGWQRMTRRVAEAAQGFGEAKGALAELNIDAVKLNQLKPEDQFEVIADAMAGLTSQSDKVRLSMKLFDSGGVALLQTMEKGSAGIRAMREEADQLGLTLSQEVADQSAAFNDELSRMQSRFTGLANTALPGFFSVLGDVADYMTTTAIPAFKFLAERIGLVELNINSLTKTETLVRMELLKEKMNDIQDAISLRSIDSPNTAPDQLKLEELKALAEEYAALKARIDAINNPAAAADAGGGSALASVSGGGAAAGAEEEKPNFFTGLTDQQMEDELQAAIDAEEKYKNIFLQEAAARASAEKQVSDLIINARMNAFQQGIGLLQAFAGKSKGAAIVAIALQKGLAIAQTIMSTQAASMRALAELGPIAGPPAAAAIQTMGKISVGLIAATGLAQAAGVGSGAGGGAAIGTPGNPITTTSVDLPGTVPVATDAGTIGTINITVNGVLTQEIVDNVLVPSIRDGIDNRDVILISGTSRNAQELLTA